MALFYCWLVSSHDHLDMYFLHYMMDASYWRDRYFRSIQISHIDYPNIFVSTIVCARYAYAEHLNALRVLTCKKKLQLLLQCDWRNRTCRLPHRNLKMCHVKFRSAISRSLCRLSIEEEREKAILSISPTMILSRWRAEWMGASTVVGSRSLLAQDEQKKI